MQNLKEKQSQIVWFFNSYPLKVSLMLTALLGCSLQLMAQTAEEQERPSFGLDYTGEVQTDLKRVRIANLLQLHADIPLSEALSFQVASLSTYGTPEELVAEDLQGYSNLNADNIPFALTVAGFTWHLNDRHSLFAGIRRIDEDYFCTDNLSLFTNSSCGIFPTLSVNFPIATYPEAALGIHYTYDVERLCLQASLYNGTGHHRFAGHDNVFRFCPKSDGVFALGQVEYRHHDSHYFLDASVHTQPDVRSSVWAHAEQALSPRLTLLATYGHAFGSGITCRDFCGIGGKYSLERMELGVFTDYTRIDGIDEWATELICSHRLTDFLIVKPVLHFINTGGTFKCIGMLRMDISI